MKTKAYAKSRDERKRVEMRFAHLKTHHGFERLRLRGLSGARDEFHLAAIVQNLKTLALRTLGPPHPDGAHRTREIAHNWISPVRVKSTHIGLLQYQPLAQRRHVAVGISSLSSRA
jgi:hypothetical protein